MSDSKRRLNEAGVEWHENAIVGVCRRCCSTAQLQCTLTHRGKEFRLCYDCGRGAYELINKETDR